MIKTFSKLLLSVLFSIVLIHHPTVYAADNTPASILVLGDSLSGAYGININQGWVALLQQQIITEGYDYKVINSSVSGDTTRTGLSRIDSVLKDHRPEIVIIALGGNDGLRGLAFSEVKASLNSIIERCKKDQVQILLVGVRMPPNYGTVYSQRFAELYRELAERYEIPLVVEMLNQVAENRELMQADGIHPNAGAQPLVMNNIWLGLKPILEEKK